MHLTEIVLANSDAGKAVLGAGAALAAAGTAVGLYRLDYERMPRVAVLTSAFFVASLIHVPLGPGASAHLVLNGLLGLLLGWAAVPAILVGLVLQAVLFSHGGVLALGVNTVVMGLPAVACHYLFRAPVRAPSDRPAFAAGVAAGATGVVLGAIMAAAALWAAGEPFHTVAQIDLSANSVVALIDGLVTGTAVMFLRKVRPEALDAPLAAPDAVEMPHA